MAELNPIKEEEYAAQFFGFSADDFTHYVKELLEDEVKVSVDRMKKSIAQHCSSADDQMLLDTAINKLVNEYMAIISNNSKSMKVKINELISIPPHILLPGDKCQEEQFTDVDEQELDSELANLEKRLKGASCMKLLLMKELEQQNDIPNIKNRINELQKLQDRVKEDAKHFEELKESVVKIVMPN